MWIWLKRKKFNKKKLKEKPSEIKAAKGKSCEIFWFWIWMGWRPTLCVCAMQQRENGASSPENGVFRSFIVWIQEIEVDFFAKKLFKVKILRFFLTVLSILIPLPIARLKNWQKFILNTSEGWKKKKIRPKRSVLMVLDILKSNKNRNSTELGNFVGWKRRFFSPRSS